MVSAINGFYIEHRAADFIIDSIGPSVVAFDVNLDAQEVTFV